MENREKALKLYKAGSKDYRKIYKLWNNATDEEMKGNHVHHKDHNHDNNHPENLVLLPPDDHAKEHGFISNWVMSQSTACERARHPEVRKRAARYGKENGMYGKHQKDLMTPEAYQLMCDSKKGKNNPQYGNVGRITGDRNPMRNLTKEGRDAFLGKKSNSHKRAIGAAAKDPERCKKISEKMKGNQSNQKHKLRILAMSEVEFLQYSSTKNPSYIKQLRGWRSTIITG